MYELSDIPDWSLVEGLGISEEDWGRKLTAEEREKMHRCSPISHVEKVITPYLLLLGEKDLRVVNHYRPFIRNLVARSIPNKIYIYPEACHPLDQVDVEADCAINIVCWLNRYLQ
ncbi:unnamed protein product [Gongylonema pulchrum]|uniref:Peptidase_S9 domain-containing protein n=1 Tax=Gongylonema pulchrum TaxID=637853 RepID=A0A183D4I2_9BILA|nr:unnamed protein product [Gongylonema pulchrum]